MYCSSTDHRVLQKHVLLLLLLRALQQHEVVVHRKPSDRVVGGAKMCESWVLVMCVSWVESSCSTESRREKTTKNQLVSICMHMHLSVRENTWAGPWAGPSNPRAGPRSCRAGPYRARSSWLPCDGPGRAAAHHIKNRWAGPPASAHDKPWKKRKTKKKIHGKNKKGKYKKIHIKGNKYPEKYYECDSTG